MVEFLLQNWVLVLAAATSGALLLAPQLNAAGGQAVGVSEAVRLINREKGVLIDVGEPGEYASGHPNGARNVPFGQLEGSKELPSNKALPVLLICPSGARAKRAATLLRKAGYERACAVQGGLAAWREANLPVEKTA